MQKNPSPAGRTFGAWVVRRRGWIIAANLIVLGLAVAFLGKRVRAYKEHLAYVDRIRDFPAERDPNRKLPAPIFNDDYHAYFEPDNPEMLAYDEFQRIFNNEDNLIIMVRAKSGDLFTPARLASLKALTDSCWHVPFVNRVDGLANFNFTYVEEDELTTEDFLDSVPGDPAAVASLRDVALRDSVISNLFLSKDAAVTQVTLRVIIPKGFPSAFQDARKRTEELVAALHARSPDLECKLGGRVMLNTSFKEFSKKDMTSLGPVMLAAVLALQILLFRSGWAAVLPLIVLAGSLLFPIGVFIGMFEMSLTNVSMCIVNMLVVMVVGDTTHIFTTFFRSVRSGMDRKSAAALAVDKNIRGCLLTSLTTAAGFYSLLAQNIPPFGTLGLMAGTGSLYAFLTTNLTLPALLALLPIRARGRAPAQTAVPAAGPHPFWEAWVDRVAAWRRPIVWTCAALTVAAIPFLFAIRVDNAPVKYFSPRTEFRQSTEIIDSSILGTDPMEFTFDAGKENGVMEPAFLAKIERFRSYLLSRPDFQVTYVSSMVDVVKRINQTLHGDDAAWYRIPDADSLDADGNVAVSARSLIAQYVFLYTMTLPRGRELTNQINVNNSKARVTAYMRNNSSWRQLEVAEEINAWLAREMPEVKARAVGAPIMFGRLMQVAIPGMIWGDLLAVLLITAILCVAFRSLRLGALSLVPNLWPIVMVSAAIGAMGYVVNFSVSIVGMVTLGVLVDDTVHFLVHYTRSRRDGLDARAALVRTFGHLGPSLINMSLILCASFGMLILSDFAINSDLGKFACSIILLAAVAELVLTPAIILTFAGAAPKAPLRADRPAAARRPEAVGA